MEDRKYYIGRYSDDSNQWYVAWEYPKGVWHDAGFWNKEMAEAWLKYGNEDKKLDVVYEDGVI